MVYLLYFYDHRRVKDEITEYLGLYDPNKVISIES